MDTTLITAEENEALKTEVAKLNLRVGAREVEIDKLKNKVQEIRASTDSQITALTNSWSEAGEQLIRLDPWIDRAVEMLRAIAQSSLPCACASETIVVDCPLKYASPLAYTGDIEP